MMAKHEAPTAPIWFPNQRVWRTIFQYIAGTIIGLFIALTTVQLFAPSVLEAAGEILPPSWLAWLTGAIAFCGTLAGVLAKIMAIPVVNEWLSRYTPFGSAPRSAIDAGTAGDAPVSITSLPDDTAV